DNRKPQGWLVHAPAYGVALTVAALLLPLIGSGTERRTVIHTIFLHVLDGLSKAVITPYCSWSARNLMPILRSFVPILYDLTHPGIKVSKFGGSFFQCGSFGLDLVCTPALFLLDLGRKRIHARENLFSGGFICIRPTFVKIRQF